MAAKPAVGAVREAGSGAARAPAPPRPPFCLRLGVTGHRSDGVPDGALPLIEQRLAGILETLAGEARRLHARHSESYAPAPPRLSLVSPLADGADLIAAEVAAAGGYDVEAILPFPRATYEEDFADAGSLARHRALLESSHCMLELPGERSHALAAYVMAGRATIAHCDILIAVWDGLPARGRGGTGEVVEYALRRGMPVIHVPTGEEAQTRILWSGFDTLSAPLRLEDVPARICDEAGIDVLLETLLAPPPEPVERAFLAAFYGESERRVRPRLEYPLMLAMTRSGSLKRSAWRVPPYAESTSAEWQSFSAACRQSSHGISSNLDGLEAAYCWTDGLADHFAQTYRSGHVFNFMLAGGSVVVALSVLILPDWKILLSLLELVLISGLIANTQIGTRREWHRRWLDYRQLAERLRPMRSLKLLGLAQPADGAGPGKRRWIDWYAAAVWRAMGCPSGRIASDRITELTAFLSAEELHPQIDWNRSSAGHIRHLDHSLHLIGTALFAATIASTALFLIGYYLFPDWTRAHTNLFVFLSGGLPALGTAIFGIRVQGDFAATSGRSLATAARLERIAAEIEKPGISLERSADLFEEAARTMIADLGEWRLAHQQRKLVIPA